FGGDAVERSDVVDADVTNPRATVIADLRRAASIPSDSYDCFILTQTLHVIDDMPAVLAECARILKPGGVLLVTLPCASRVCLEYGRDGDFWRMTEAGARRLFERAFPADHLEIRSHGNVLVSTAFLYGLACHELAPEEFEAADPFHPLLVSVRAVKPRAAVEVEAAPGEAGLVLLYHRVAETADDVHGLCVPPALFREQMEHLRAHYRPMALEELADAARRGRLPPRAVAVTFDDGYVDNLLAASPILGELGLPATFFVTGEGWDAPHEFWWDALERLLLSSQPVPRCLELTLGGERRCLATSTTAERRAAHATLHPQLVGRSREERDQAMRAIASWAGDPARRPGARAMTAEEIRLLASRPGHAVGAHTTHHLALSTQPAAVVEEEIAGHKDRLQRLLGGPVAAFAYPFGDGSPHAAEAVRRAAFGVAVTCEERPVRPGDAPLQLPRLEVKAGPLEAFAAALRRHGGP
ncbi:MAG TPA: polysaccharide deacetylase family protein, partial [Vicinamibacteria bacterium]